MKGPVDIERTTLGLQTDISTDRQVASFGPDFSIFFTWHRVNFSLNIINWLFSYSDLFFVWLSAFMHDGKVNNDTDNITGKYFTTAYESTSWRVSWTDFSILSFSSNDIYSGNNSRCGDSLVLSIMIRVLMKVT